MSKTERQRSIPLHSVESQDIEYLQQILRCIREHTNLSFEFHGFINGERWASNDRIIERQPSEMELSDGNPF